MDPCTSMPASSRDRAGHPDSHPRRSDVRPAGEARESFREDADMPTISHAVVGATGSKARAAQPLDASAVVLPALPAKAAPTSIGLLQFIGVALSPRLDITRYTKQLPGAAAIACHASTQFAAEPPGFAVNGVTSAG